MTDSFNRNKSNGNEHVCPYEIFCYLKTSAWQKMLRPSTSLKNGSLTSHILHNHKMIVKPVLSTLQTDEIVVRKLCKIYYSNWQLFSTWYACKFYQTASDGFTNHNRNEFHLLIERKGTRSAIDWYCIKKWLKNSPNLMKVSK